MSTAAAEFTTEVVAKAAPTIYQLAKEYGIFAVMCCFFIWWSYTREAQLNKRLDAQDEFIRGTLVKTVDKNTTAVEGFSQILKLYFDKRTP